MAIDNSPAILSQQNYIAAVFPQAVQRKEAAPPGQVMQMQLKERATYCGLAAVDYFDDPYAGPSVVVPNKKRKKGGAVAALGQTEVGKLYFVMETNKDWTRLKLATTDTSTTFWIETDKAQNEKTQWFLEPEPSKKLVEEVGEDDFRWKEFKKNPMPVDPVATDVKQGGVGDCWLLACMAALASSAYWIEELKKSVVVNVDGTVTIKLYKGGNSIIKPSNKASVPVDAIVSRWLPTFIQGSEELMYACTLKNAVAEENDPDVNVNPHIWPALIEKGVAALHENLFWKLDNRGPEKGFATLTSGQGLKTYSGDNIDASDWLEILTIISNDGAGTVSTKKEQADLTASGDPLLITASVGKMTLDHVYYITGADIGASTLTVKNPHQTVHPDPLTFVKAKAYLSKIAVIPKP